MSVSGKARWKTAFSLCVCVLNSDQKKDGKFF